MEIRRRPLPFLWCAALAVAMAGCCVPEPPPEPPQEGEPVFVPRPVGDGAWQVVAEYPHDRRAFTQGLVYLDGTLYEGTGLNGESSLRRVDLDTGSVLQRADLDRQYFGEGIAVVGERIYQLTWRNEVGFLYDRSTFARLGGFAYPTEGWGLTYDGAHLILSNGSDRLYFYTPEPFALARTVDVTDRRRPVSRLNELEYIDGAVWANVWQTDVIVRIDPATGEVLERIDLEGLLEPEDRAGADVLNGIAHDAATGRIFVTGKRWPKLFVIARTGALP